MDTLNLIFLIISGIFFLSGFWFMFRFPVCRLMSGEKVPNVSIIIPARNEEHNIGKLLDSINAQVFKPVEIILVNDHSTDKTKQISLQKGALVLDSKELPSGWFGKPWACFQGAQHAKGDILLFLDADTELMENGLEKMLTTYQHLSKQEKTAMSISPYHKVNKLYEEFSLIFNIIMTGSMNAFTPVRDAEPSGLFGPCLLVTKEDYFLINGHESVKDKILENVFIGEKFKEKGIRLKCFSGQSSLSYRMYPEGLKSLINGWSKAFASGAGKTPFLILLNIIAWISAGFIIPVFLIYSYYTQGNTFIWFLFYILYALQLARMMKNTGSFRYLSALLFPVHLVFYCIVFFLSLYYQKAGRTVQWKSRNLKG